MTTALEAAPAAVPARERQRWHTVVLACIVAASLALYAWGIGRADLHNVFFAVGVRSMSHNFTNFLFGSWDPAGVMALDKPPMAFWPQVLLTKIFGFHGWALVLPQVIEGGLAVVLLHRTVRRWAGENVALLAALFLALTPITVVISRTNNTDTLLTLWCVAAAYALVRSLQADERGARLWLMQAALWIGCAFTTKMLAGWLVIPAIAVAYLVGRKASWTRRVVDLLWGTAVLAVSSLWWVLLTTWWPGKKPFTAGSTDGSTWNLVFVQNGWHRLVGLHEAASSAGASSGGGSQGGGAVSPAAANVVTIGRAIGAAFNGGAIGPSRIFGRTVGGQISWLLPLALLVLVVVVASWVWAGVSDRFQVAGWTMWGIWILVAGVLFSFQQGTYHAYYTTQMAPAIAAVAAAGLSMLWRYRHDWRWVILPVAIAGTAVWAWVLVSRDTDYYGWLRYLAAGLALVAVIGLVIRRYGPPAAGRPTAVIAVAGILAVPAVWSVDAAVNPGTGFADGAIPTAGPAGWSFGAAATVPGALQDFLKTGTLPGGSDFSSGKLAPKQRQLLDYVSQNAGNAQIALAVEGGGLRAENYAANTDKTVVAMGGFEGVDPEPSLSQLNEWKRDGRLAFVLSQPPKKGFGDFGNTPNALKRMAWAQQNCTPVPSTTYGVPITSPTQVSVLASLVGFGEQTLYRC